MKESTKIKKNTKRIIRWQIIASIIFLNIGATHVNAQQHYIITQYMFNGLVLNPAYAGSHEAWSFTLMSRHQWSGIEDAPRTQSFSAHGPIDRYNISGGFLFVNDKFGAIELNNIYTTYAYRISSNGGKNHLSLGLQGGVSTFQVDLSNAYLINQSDPALYENNELSVFPNFGVGVYYSTKNVYAGLSIPYIVNNRLNQSSRDLSRQSRHYYFTAGSTHQLNHSVKFKPSLLVRYVDGVPIDVDLNSSLVFNEIIWLGVTYRWQDSFDFILELQVTDNLRFGYSFDLTTSELSAVTSGSHEFVINYRLKKNHHKVYHPRRF